MEHELKPGAAATGSDDQLLEEFARTGSEAAFGELVNRYLGLVLAVALRKLRNPEWAEEAAQNAFTILARKAKRLRNGTILGAWLHRVVWIECSEMLRREARRKEIMSAYAEKTRADQEGKAAPEAMAEGLDEALAGLPEADRAVLLPPTGLAAHPR